jgi:hypothetical protein
MGRHREGFFGQARAKGSRQDRRGIDGAQVHKRLEDGTKRRYGDAYPFWLEYVLCPCGLLRFPPPFPLLRLALLILSPLICPFNSFCAEYGKDPDIDVYDLEILKDFIQEVAYSIDGIEGGDDKPPLKSVKYEKILELNFDGVMTPIFRTACQGCQGSPRPWEHKPVFHSLKGSLAFSFPVLVRSLVYT